MSQYQFSVQLFSRLFKYNISSIEDFKQRTANELYHICEEDYNLTVKTYNILRRNGIKL